MKKILIIEDELAYSTLLNDLLSANGYKVFLAENGEQGLELVKKENFDLILLDIRMPKMDGMTMLNQLRKIDTAQKIKVIVLTNLEPDDAIISTVIDSEAFYYFIKSDTKLAELMQKIKEMIN